MGDMASDDRKGVALAFMKRASRDTFRLCAQHAEAMAASIESGELPRMSAPNALRLLASMFEASSRLD